MLREDQVAMIGLASKHFGSADAACSRLAGTRYLEAVIAQRFENRLCNGDIEHGTRPCELNLERSVIRFVGFRLTERFEMYGGRRPVMGLGADRLLQRARPAAIKVLRFSTLGRD